MMALFLAALFLAIGLIIFLKYDEKGISRILVAHQKK